MILYVTEKCVYGNDLIYPDCDKSKELCKSLGLKTMNATAFSVCKVLGVTVKVRASEKTLVGGESEHA
jgi:hypothetical protein